jgi:23S rRNA (adenine2503-C2)-methyltransferase
MQTNYQDRIYLLDFSREELAAFSVGLGLEKYRADQLFKGIYHQRLPTFANLSTFTKVLRQKLDDRTTLRTLGLTHRVTSKLDNTIKFLWALNDGKHMESVVIFEGRRTTYCISTQVGCALKCDFCATGEMGFLRNLGCGEIVEQVLQMSHLSRTTPTNIVFMGMGEPLLNTTNVLKAASIMSDPEGLAIARKRITLSTSGIAPAIRKIADMDFPYSLAVSLNAADDRKRSLLMPINKQFPLKQLLESLVYLYLKQKTRITYEYVLIAGLNDREIDAENLIKLCKKVPSKINLIPCNIIKKKYQPPTADHINWFASFLRDHHCTVTLRLRKGHDIKAACGQLYAAHAGISSAYKEIPR